MTQRRHRWTLQQCVEPVHRNDARHASQNDRAEPRNYFRDAELSGDKSSGQVLAGRTIEHLFLRQTRPTDRRCGCTFPKSIIDVT
jgi:hypothetical protein